MIHYPNTCVGIAPHTPNIDVLSHMTDALVKVAVKPQQFLKAYIPMFDLREAIKVSSPLYEWHP